MSNEFKKSGRLTYLPQYNHKDDSETEATIIEVVNRRKPQKNSDLSLTTKIKSFILLVCAVILIGIAGRSETDPTFPDRLLILWSVCDIAACMLAIVLVNILKEVFKK